MKKYGEIVTRAIDVAGRIYIPKELREKAGIKPFEIVSIVARHEEIIITRPNPRCILCGNTDALLQYKGDSYICLSCCNDISILKDNLEG